MVAGGLWWVRFEDGDILGCGRRERVNGGQWKLMRKPAK